MVWGAEVLASFRYFFQVLNILQFLASGRAKRAPRRKKIAEYWEPEKNIGNLLGLLGAEQTA